MNKSTNVLTKICLLSSLALITACSGGSSSRGGSDTFSAREAAASDLASAYLGADGQPLATAEATSNDVLLSQGNGTFSGAVSGTIDDGTFLADLDLTVDFAGESLTGAASDFVLDDDTALTGSVTGSGDINAGGLLPQVALTMTGDLENDGTTLSSEIALDGAFYETASSASGAVAGEAEGFIGVSTITDGVFAAER